MSVQAFDVCVCVCVCVCVLRQPEFLVALPFRPHLPGHVNKPWCPGARYAGIATDSKTSTLATLAQAQ